MLWFQKWHKLFSICALLIILLGFMAWSKLTAPDVMAQRKMANGDYASAISILEEAMELRERDDGMRAQYTLALAGAEEWTKLQRFLYQQLVLEKRPTQLFSESGLALAEHYLGQHRWDEGMEWYERFGQHLSFEQIDRYMELRFTLSSHPITTVNFSSDPALHPFPEHPLFLVEKTRQNMSSFYGEKWFNLEMALNWLMDLDQIDIGQHSPSVQLLFNSFVSTLSRETAAKLIAEKRKLEIADMDLPASVWEALLQKKWSDKTWHQILVPRFSDHPLLQIGMELDSLEAQWELDTVHEFDVGLTPSSISWSNQGSKFAGEGFSWEELYILDATNFEVDKIQQQKIDYFRNHYWNPEGSALASASGIHGNVSNTLITQENSWARIFGWIGNDQLAFIYFREVNSGYSFSDSMIVNLKTGDHLNIDFSRSSGFIFIGGRAVASLAPPMEWYLSSSSIGQEIASLSSSPEWLLAPTLRLGNSVDHSWFHYGIDGMWSPDSRYVATQLDSAIRLIDFQEQSWRYLEDDATLLGWWQGKILLRTQTNSGLLYYTFDLETEERVMLYHGSEELVAPCPLGRYILSANEDKVVLYRTN